MGFEGGEEGIWEGQGGWERQKEVQKRWRWGLEEMKKVLGEIEVGFGGGRSGAQKGGVGRGDHEHRRGGAGGTIDSTLLSESE